MGAGETRLTAVLVRHIEKFRAMDDIMGCRLVLAPHRGTTAQRWVDHEDSSILRGVVISHPEQIRARCASRVFRKHTALGRRLWRHLGVGHDDFEDRLKLRMCKSDWREGIRAMSGRNDSRAPGDRPRQ